MKIGLLHGAHSSSNSFNFISQELEDYKIEPYDVDWSKVSPSSFIEQAEEHEIPDILIGHSYGGYAAALWAIRQPKIKRVVAITAPLGGVTSFKTDLISLNLHHLSTTYKEIRDGIKEIDILSIVSYNKNSWGLDSDGVLSSFAQESKAKNRSEYSLNHFEVLLSHKLRSEIKEWIIK
jgi:pimeloyl-ACP methyl ester carboxylesterase